MRFFHLSDLHIGKNLNGYSLAENQKDVLRQVVSYARDRRPDAILLCGDIYDRTVPTGEAHKMFDGFLTDLSEIEPTIPILVIAGNHDSPQRLAYGEGFLEKHKIYISVMPPLNEGEYLKKVTLNDAYGPVNFYLLPFTKPGYIRTWSVNENDTYESAISQILKREEINIAERNVLLSHQFYVGQSGEADTCESEQAVLMAGGLDKISCHVVEAFDYVALGHLHGSQRVGSEKVRYCGTPYKYSVSEEHHKKSVIEVSIGEKGCEPEITYLPLKGKQDVRKIRGLTEEILRQAKEENNLDFVSITVTDDEEQYHLREKLKEAYPYLLEVKVDNNRTRARLLESSEEIVLQTPMDAFSSFFEAIHHTAMTEQERMIMERLFEKVEEERE